MADDTEGEKRAFAELRELMDAIEALSKSMGAAGVYVIAALRSTDGMVCTMGEVFCDTDAIGRALEDVAAKASAGGYEGGDFPRVH